MAQQKINLIIKIFIEKWVKKKCRHFCAFCRFNDICDFEEEMKNENMYAKSKTNKLYGK